MVGYGRHGEPGGAVSWHVVTRDDEQVSHRPPASNKVEHDALVGKDHGASEDAVVPGRDAAFPVQVDDGVHVDRHVGLADVQGDREAIWAAAKDADPAGAEQLMEALGGFPGNGAIGRGRLGDPVQQPDRVGVRLGPCCRLASYPPPMLTTMPVATSNATVMTCANESMARV